MLVPEMNAGQLRLEVERILGRDRVARNSPHRRRADHAGRDRSQSGSAIREIAAGKEAAS